MAGRQLTLHLEGGYNKGSWFGLKCLLWISLQEKTKKMLLPFSVNKLKFQGQCVSVDAMKAHSGVEMCLQASLIFWHRSFTFNSNKSPT